MRVTKTVREYIVKEVKARIEPKYAEQRAVCEQKKMAMDKFLEGWSIALRNAYDDYFEKNFSAISDFCEDKRISEYDKPQFSFRGVITIKNNVNDDLFCLNRVIEKEINNKVNDIIVELEFGGTKDDLIKMLNEI